MNRFSIATTEATGSLRQEVNRMERVSLSKFEATFAGAAEPLADAFVFTSLGTQKYKKQEPGIGSK
jgi:hypothetical protein